MAARTEQQRKQDRTKGGDGWVSQVIGAVVDVEFPEGQLPNIFDAIIAKTRSARRAARSWCRSESRHWAASSM